MRHDEDILNQLRELQSRIGPNRHGLIKVMIGVVIVCMLLGSRLPKAVEVMLKVNDEMIEEYCSAPIR